MSAVCRFLLLAATVMLTSVAFAQERCATDVFEKKALKKNPLYREQFEQWMQKKVTQQKSRAASARTQSTYKIPVVVHILHNGEAVGTGLNLSDEQVISQIQVLNDDYQRLNADRVNTPSEFSPVASSLDIEFILAKQDPDGLPTTGITRTLATKNGYDAYADNTEIKAQSYWPSEDYLNIWVVNLIDDFLGVAQFPVTDLQGTEGPYDAITDGVVIHYKAFGSIAANGSFSLNSKYNLGRTTTHEVGHYLGLLHVFGNFNGCNTTDYVSDTPIQSERTFTCPSSPLTQCGHHVMFQNYMDYTDDACMNLFTAGQIERITTVMDNSPRRNTLSTSHGLNEPVTTQLDLEAKSVVAPAAVTCGKSITPRVSLRNRGSNTVTSAKIAFAVDGSTIETKTFTLNLNSFDIADVSFSAIDLVEPGNNNITYTILEVNGTTDDQTDNNTASLNSVVSASINPPSLEPFNTLPSDWTIVNPDASTTWANVTAPKSSITNKAMAIDFYNYQNVSAQDQLISPFFSIPEDDALLKFDHAYAMFPGIVNESLRVLISVGCSADLADAIEIYNKKGTALATVMGQQTQFIPNNENQWTSDGISLAPYAGQHVRLIFESTNQNGNNLYLDNVQVSVGELNDVKLVSVLSPGPVFCESKPKPVISVQNMGTQTVTQLTVTTTVNNIVNATETIAGISMTPGAMIEVTLQALNLTQSTNNIAISINNPDVAGDDVPSDNLVAFTRIFNTTRESVPLRQNFDENVTNWTIYGPSSTSKWVGTPTNGYNNSLVFKAFSNTLIDEESWFVSPVLNFTKSTEGSLHFTTSYGRRLAASEKLKVVVSEDCGMTYDQVIFEKSGLDLADETVGVEWIPTDTSKWSDQYVSLNEFAGKDNLRFAFIVTNDNGNNLYLDNIEFFIEDNPNPPRTDEPFFVYNNELNPYEFFVTFNLAEKADAHLVIYNSVGQVMVDSQLPGTLNQTYTVNLYGQSAGIYIARLQTPSLTRSSKLFIGK